MEPTITALFGGAFDPVHLGHIAMAKSLIDCGCVSEVRFIPYRFPPHKPPPCSSDRQRVDILRLAIGKYKQMSVDLRELQRTEGMSYTFDTVSEIRQELAPSTPLSLVLGLDAYRQLPTWKKYWQLPHLAHMLVFPRTENPPVRFAGDSRTVCCDNGTCVDKLWKEKSAIEALTHEACGLLHKVAHPKQDVSSSGIRSALANHAPIPYHFLPDNVSLYIKKHAIYG